MIGLHICTLYKDKPTPEMEYSFQILKRVEGIDLSFIWIKCGEFSHRHKPDVPDPEQCRLRNIYLDQIPIGDWLLVLDSDEILFGALGQLPYALKALEDNNFDYLMINELLPDYRLLMRPRLIHKREGLKYGGPYMKHDFISLRYEPEDFNYIDVHAEDRSGILDFIGFFHNKDGAGMQIYNSQKLISVPKNLYKLDDIGKIYNLRESMPKDLPPVIGECYCLCEGCRAINKHIIPRVDGMLPKLKKED